MNEALLCYVAVPCTQQVQDIINFLSITNVRHPAYMEHTSGCALFIYNTCLELEDIDLGTEWVINNDEALIVLTLFANKDFQGICDYLNSIPERPFNVYIATTCSCN